MQLAGHLQGKALQEWNLLTEEERSTYQGAVEKLRDVLGPSHVLAAQDFQHTCQEDSESMAAFIRRLEQIFCVDHGCDKLGRETPCTYDQQVFSLDGHIALTVTFRDKTVMFYVKMDATEQLLLGEGVCRQLGIITYHPVFEPCHETIEASESTVRVQLCICPLSEIEIVEPVIATRG